jgi:putative transposase
MLTAKSWGSSPSARLQVAPSTYYGAKSRPPCQRAVKDAATVPALKALFTDNYSVYGARKLHKAARRAGHDLGRDQVARLMRKAGIQGARRGRRVFTTRADKTAARPPDLMGIDHLAPGLGEAGC